MKEFIEQLSLPPNEQLLTFTQIEDKEMEEKTNEMVVQWRNERNNGEIEFKLVK